MSKGPPWAGLSAEGRGQSPPMGLGGQESQTVCLSVTSPQVRFSVLLSSPSIFYSQTSLSSFTFSIFSVFLLPFPFLPSLFPTSALGFPHLHLPLSVSPGFVGSLRGLSSGLHGLLLCGVSALKRSGTGLTSGSLHPAENSLWRLR